MFFFFFNDTAPTEIYTLSLHGALPISVRAAGGRGLDVAREPARHRPVGAHVDRLRDLPLRAGRLLALRPPGEDRKSTRLNSSHANISYAVFCLKKKKIHVDDTLCSPLI